MPKQLKVGFIDSGEYGDVVDDVTEDRSDTSLYRALYRAQISPFAVAYAPQASGTSIENQKQRVANFAAQYHLDNRFYDTPEALLENEGGLDAIFLTMTGNHPKHTDIVEQALSRNLHLLIHRIPTQLETLKHIQTLQQNSTAKLYFYFPLRFAAAMQRIRNIISKEKSTSSQAPQFGRITQLNASFGTGPYPNSLGFIYSACIQAYDIIRCIVKTADPKNELQEAIIIPSYTDERIHYAISLIFKNQITANLTLSSQRIFQRPLCSNLEITGRNKYIQMSDDIFSRLHYYYREGQHDACFVVGEDAIPDLVGASRLLSLFKAAARGDNTANIDSLPTLKDAIQLQRFCDALAESAKSLKHTGESEVYHFRFDAENDQQPIRMKTSQATIDG